MTLGAGVGTGAGWAVGCAEAVAGVGSLTTEAEAEADAEAEAAAADEDAFHEDTGAVDGVESPPPTCGLPRPMNSTMMACCSLSLIHI